MEKTMIETDKRFTENVSRSPGGYESLKTWSFYGHKVIKN